MVLTILLVDQCSQRLSQLMCGEQIDGSHARAALIRVQTINMNRDIKAQQFGATAAVLLYAPCCTGQGGLPKLASIQWRPRHQCTMVQANAGALLLDGPAQSALKPRSRHGLVCHLQHSAEVVSPGPSKQLAAHKDPGQAASLRTRPAADLGYGSRGSIAARLAAAMKSAMTWLSSTVCACTHGCISRAERPSMWQHQHESGSCPPAT